MVWRREKEDRTVHKYQKQELSSRFYYCLCFMYRLVPPRRGQNVLLDPIGDYRYSGSAATDIGVLRAYQSIVGSQFSNKHICLIMDIDLSTQ